MNTALKSVKPVRRQTLQDEIYRQLCDLILEGNLAPGESITVASIADAFDVSPMPVREAISRLMAAGALTVVSGRSIGVPRLDHAVFTDLRNVRLEIEPLCVRWANENKTQDFIEDLSQKLNSMVAAERAGEVQGFIQANYDFHFSIYKQAASPTLLEIISNIWLRKNPYFHLLARSGHYKVSNEQHRRLYEGLVDGNIEQSMQALRDDINSAYEVMMSVGFFDV